MLVLVNLDLSEKLKHLTDNILAISEAPTPSSTEMYTARAIQNISEIEKSIVVAEEATA